ncbi:LCP family protein [Micromonospora radicis]|uniref:LytR family transcriptional regulator n=1 Tax=Micromonospora radicis TaxID=1894971 RepID=A0A418MX80_9ACTN|nr:LCP family protein [Micromonospora radicis]RIV39638.1 LytR family transcriptional regulator [Micromonospora radicis]
MPRDFDLTRWDHVGTTDAGTPVGRTSPHRWIRLTALIGALVLALVVVGGGLGGWLYIRSLEQRISKVDAFQGLLAEQRPPRAVDEALNILVVGRDEPDGTDTTARADSIMLVHIPHSRDRAYLISIPRDTWTDVPTSPDGGDTRKGKINAALAWGGVPLLVRAVENFTSVRVDHVVLLDFTGFTKVIDILGGVDVTVDTSFTSAYAAGRVFRPGVHRMDSTVALEYARERHQFADGDFSRMRHQQAIVAAVLQEVTRKGILTSPGRLDDFLRVAAGAVEVDHDLPVAETVWGLRLIGAEDLTFLTSPNVGPGMVGDQSVILPDEPAAAELFAAVRSGTVNKWLAEHPEATVR